VLEERIIELEVKNAFLGESLDQLNAVVIRQQQQIDLLIREVMALKAQASTSDVLRPDNLAEEIPPHY
jgi:SlyX protein